MAAATVAAALLAAAGDATATTRGRLGIASVDSSGAQGNETSHEPDVSADGRFVAFASDATNLVPGDTNQNSDVFVHDRVTGVTQRVSLAWNGMESRGDSWCPAISADGRFVAFLSRGWNMYRGGRNVGTPLQQVHVHDRQSGRTERLSVGQGGAEPTGHSFCPDISGDGRLVVFSSSAKNLIPQDENNMTDVFVADRVAGTLRRVSERNDGVAGVWNSELPAISRDGRFVSFRSWATNLVSPPPPNDSAQLYVRDLQTGAIEIASVSSGDPGDVGASASDASALSDDGRYVAFVSWSWNLTPDSFPGALANVFVRDRVAKTTVLASRTDLSITECGRPANPFPCQFAESLDPSISGDGRFVAFTSFSHQLLPASIYGGSQTYLFDRVGGRLRRLSVDAGGTVGDNCSDDPVLSRDGTLVAYRSKATTLLASDANAEVDVYGQRWSCAASGVCRRIAECPSTPRSCIEADRSKLRIQKRAPGGVGRDRLYWAWRSNEPGSDQPFPEPDGDSLYQLCVYARPERRLAVDIAAADAPACVGGTPVPCWKESPSGYRLLAADQGIDRLTLRDTAGAKQISASGKGEMLDLPHLPLDGSQGLTVQLQEKGSGRCWSADFPAESIAKNHAGSAEPGQSRIGRLLARFD